MFGFGKPKAVSIIGPSTWNMEGYLKEISEYQRYQTYMQLFDRLLEKGQLTEEKYVEYLNEIKKVMSK